MLNQFFIIFSLIVIGGIGYVIYSLKNDKENENDPESLSITEMLSDKNFEINLSKDSDRESPATESAEKKTSHKSFYNKSRSKTETIQSFDSQFELEPQSTSKSFLKNISFSKLKNIIPFLKKDPEPAFQSLEEGEEDEMLRIMRANLELTKKTDSKSPSKKAAQKNTPTEGTASLKTVNSENINIPEQPTPKNTLQSDKEPPQQTPPSTQSDEKNNEKNHITENTNVPNKEYSDLHQKYTQQEKILKEQNNANTKINQELQNEIANRKSFDQVKSLLEKELTETKETSRKALLDLKIANEKSTSFQKKIQEMEEKLSQLENKLSEKEQEIEEILRNKENPKLTPVDLLNLNTSTDNNTPKKDPNNEINDMLIKDPWVDENPSSSKEKLPPLTKTQATHNLDLTKKEHDHSSNGIDTSTPRTISANPNEDNKENLNEDNTPEENNKFISLQNDILKPAKDEENITLDLRKSPEDSKPTPNQNDNPSPNKDI